MRKVRIILFLGAWVALLPYLGFPFFWKNILLSLSGLGLIYLSFLWYREYKTKEVENKTFDNFSENKDFSS